jgi:sulfane dehydrogenase subunit SoxC
MRSKHEQPERIAGNGILSRRIFLEAALAAGAAGAVEAGAAGAGAEPLAVAPTMQEPGAPLAGYGQPSRFEGKVVRSVPAATNPATI